MTVEDLVEKLRKLPQSYVVVTEVFRWDDDEMADEICERVRVRGEEVVLS